jgi:hypothetical protein
VKTHLILMMSGLRTKSLQKIIKLFEELEDLY